MIICKKCGIEKPWTTKYFYENGNVYKGKKYLAKVCKECAKEIQRNLRQDNKETICKKDKIRYDKNKESRKKKSREYYNRNKKKCNERSRQYHKNNKEECALRERTWRNYNREWVNERNRQYDKDKRQNDPVYKIMRSLRSRVRGALNGGWKSGHTVELLGCTGTELKLYLESGFLSGMTWDNYGRKGWHIDHIIPCATFDLSKPEEQKKCFHHTNLQPLWWSDNIRKGKNDIRL